MGAESTGKTTLSHALAAEFGGVQVAEELRHFVEREGRPPTRQEQGPLLQRQIDAEHRARAGGARWVVSDSGALMTAVYSVVYFGDRGLLAAAADRHRSAYCTTLWCDIDVPWRPEPGQRDGPEIRVLTHRTIAAVLSEFDIPATLVGGDLPTRLAQSRRALRSRR